MSYTPRVLTEEERLYKAHIALMGSKHFIAYSGILMLGKTDITDKPGVTAYTDGVNVRYGREYVRSLDDAKLRGIILHENKHKMYRHITLWKHLWNRGIYAVDSAGNKVNLVNLAADYVINLEIIEEAALSSALSIQLPDGCLLDNKYANMNTQQVFEALLKEYEDKGGTLTPGGTSFDEHDWEAGNSMSPEERDAIAGAIDAAIRQGAILAGQMEGNRPRGFDELMDSKVDWREQLREFVSATCKGRDDSTWRKPSRRWLQHDIYMPTSIFESLDRVTIGIDTSGSIGQEELTEFMSEVVAILQAVQPNTVDLIYWDTAVANHEVYTMEEAASLATTTKPAGGGGTSPSCMSKYLNDKKIDSTCIVMLTDGYVGSDWGSDWRAPVLWAITSDVIAPEGVSIKIGE